MEAYQVNTETTADSDGNLKKYKIVRGLMRSIARLTYDQVQAGRDGVKDDVTDTLMDDVIDPLYAAYAVLDKARQKRGALELDLPERQILIDKDGKIKKDWRKVTPKTHVADVIEALQS